jgi:hypothetical protein
MEAGGGSRRVRWGEWGGVEVAQTVYIHVSKCKNDKKKKNLKGNLIIKLSQFNYVQRFLEHFH